MPQSAQDGPRDDADRDERPALGEAVGFAFIFEP
jgi:hypothetical protein